MCRNGADLSAIRQAFDQSKAALERGDSQAYGNCNEMFHMAIWTAKGNKKIVQTLSQLWNGLSMGHIVTRESYAQISMAEHTQIMEALERRDAKAAEELMDRHIHRSMENILTHLSAAPQQEEQN